MFVELDILLNTKPTHISFTYFFNFMFEYKVRIYATGVRN